MVFNDAEQSNRINAENGLLALVTQDQFSSVSRSVVSNSLQLHESQHAGPPCPLPTPGVHLDSRPSSQWWVSRLILCHPLLLLPPIPPSIKIFSNESTLLMRWPKYWSFSFSIIPSRIDAFELWCWRRLLRVPWTARRSNQSILKETALLFIVECFRGV